MTSKAERKRNKRKFISLAGGEQVEQRATGRDRSHTNGPQEDPRATACKARIGLLSQAGVDKPDTYALHPMAGCIVGRAILADNIGLDERADLWNAVCHIRRTWVAYGRAIGAPNRYAQCLRILLPAEQFEVSSSTPYDDRPQEDRDRAAVSAYMRAQGWLMRGSAADLSACIGAVVDDQDGHDWQSVKRALSHVADGMAGTKA